MEIKEFFVDGVEKTFVGYPVSKVTFFSVNDVEKNESGDVVEKREGVIRIAISTNRLLEFCIKTIETFQKNKESIESSSDSFKNKFNENLADLNVIEKD